MESVGAPTRGSNLLDLFLTDLPGNLNIDVYPGVSDHSMVLGSLNLQVVGAVQHERDCYIYKAAKWDKLRKTLSETDWSYISRNDP